MTDDRPRGPESVVQWAVRTGRIPPYRAVYWQKRVHAERVALGVQASNGPTEIESWIMAMTPVTSAAAAPPDPGEYDGLFPAASHEEADARFDAWAADADAGHARDVAEQATAASAFVFTDAEIERIFGPD